MADKKHKEELEAMGWKVIVLWECELKKNFEDVMKQTILEIRML